MNVSTKRFAPVSAAGAGANQLVAAVPNNRIVVIGYVIVAAGAVSVKFQSGANDITGLMALAANGGLVVPAGDEYAALFQTNVNEALNLNNSAAVAVGGHLAYRLDRG